MSRNSLACIPLLGHAKKIRHTMAAAGRSNHDRTLSVAANAIQSMDQIRRIDTADTGQQLVTAQYDGQ
jgi:methylmalonyl-CoA mutase cobalamin-binding subunit